MKVLPYYKISSIYLLLLIIGIVGAYERYIGNARHKDYPNNCYHKEHNKLMEFGEVWRPINHIDQCEKLICRDDYVIMIQSCPRYQVPEGCKVISHDFSKSFPKCCPSLECQDQKSGEITIRETYTEYEDINDI